MCGRPPYQSGFEPEAWVMPSRRSIHFHLPPAEAWSACILPFPLSTTSTQENPTTLSVFCPFKQQKTASLRSALRESRSAGNTRSLCHFVCLSFSVRRTRSSPRANKSGSSFSLAVFCSVPSVWYGSRFRFPRLRFFYDFRLVALLLAHLRCL